MNFRYDESSDVAYIGLGEASAIESEEIEEGIVVDYSVENKVVGVEIQHFSRRFLSIFEATKDEKLMQILSEAA